MHYGGNTTCVQVEAEGSDELLIFDCGTGFRNLGNELLNDGKPLKGRIFITHPHWDHLQGFPFFKPFYNKESFFRINMPPQGQIGCKEILQGHMSDTFFPVSMDMLEADLDCDTILPSEKEYQGYSIEYMWATHTIPTAIYKIKIGEKKIVFAPDNELRDDNSDTSVKFEKQFRTFINGVDLLIHDGQFSREQYKTRRGWGHSAWENVVEIARGENVKNLCLTHHDPDSNDMILKNIENELLDKYSESFEFVSLAKEGQEIILPQ
ncbi:MAG TPA: MBL fold metallo-hydrolase [Gracilimonas sp.]|uniref:MBL fold metallo-hydrolase n=1 Tax=Gracilimonas sp. TaxID=1974203 RepID=UPI002D92710B|nr:MBL fold metallo-hydrolase [Gracilimonas sp.]